MTKPTLSLCMIVRDVAPFIERCLGSILDEVDELCVVDTGSQDDTIEVIRSVVRMRAAYRPLTLRLEHFTPETHPACFVRDVPESYARAENAGYPAPPLTTVTGKLLLADYAKARQLSFDIASSDYLMWIDSDDIVAGAKNIPELLLGMRDQKIDTALFSYDYDQDDEERSTCQLIRARITRRGGPARWMHPIHETLGPFGESKIYGQVMIHHTAKKIEQEFPGVGSRVPLRNYKVLVHSMLRLGDEKAGVHPRMWFYLGNETRTWNKPYAIKFFTRYIFSSDWPEEMSLAHIYIGELKEQDGDYLSAEAHYAAATSIFEHKPEGHFGLARIAYYKKDWASCIRHHEKGRLVLASALDVLHYNPLDRRYYPALCASHAYLETGHPKRAFSIANEGLQLVPKDINLLAARERAVDILARRQRTMVVHIFTGGSVEPWNAHTPYTTGIGGSETAAINIARTLAARGHQVTVFCDHDGPSTKVEGVSYCHYDDYPLYGMADVFISSRRPAAFTNLPVKARLRVLWLHDNHVGPAVAETCRGLLAADLVMPVSNWHRQYICKRYPFLDPNRVVATRNGIDERLYSGPLPEKKNKLIYASSADRGLLLALDYFELVRDKIKDAELHIFYGFNTVEKMIEQGSLKNHDAAEMRAQIAELKQRCEKTDGVVMRGRVGQRELAQEFMEAKVWFYPTFFEESSCITAMQSQAAACTPITTALAALNESVHHGFLLAPPCTSPTYRDKFVERTIWALTHEKERSMMALVGRENSLGYHSWTEIAEEWEDLFCEHLSR